MKMFGYVILLPILAAPAFAQREFTIPPNAISSGDLTGSSHWTWVHDSGTPGESVGSSAYPVVSPSLDQESREFSISYSHEGGERYSLTFAHDAEATHFIYDTYVYIVDPAQLANIEMDMNQVMADGKTVIYAFQCSAYTGTWEFSTIANNHPHWHSSGLPCNPEKWAANTWHHVQIGSHRSSTGVVTYDWVNLDGVCKELNNATGNGAINLHWSPGDLNLNLQIDGASKSSGSVKIYADELTIYYW